MVAGRVFEVHAVRRELRVENLLPAPQALISMRRHTRQVDEPTRSRELTDALLKLERGAQYFPYDRSPATAHLFIVNPLSGGALHALFSTHPPIEERIRRLRALGASGRSWR